MNAPSSSVTPPSAPRKRWIWVAIAGVVVAAVVVVAFIIVQLMATVTVREEVSPNPATPGQTVTFRYIVRNGLSSAISVQSIDTVLYYNGTLFLTVNFTSSSTGWLTSTVQPGQEATVFQGSFPVTAGFVGTWLERAIFRTSAGAFTSEVTYRFNP